MKIDYSRIFPEDLKKYVSMTQLEEIKACAKSEKNFICGKYCYHSENSELKFMRKAVEYAYNTFRYADRSDVEKALLAANIALSDKKTVEILTKGQFDRESLLSYIKVLNYLKCKNNNDEITTNDAEIVNKISRINKKLITLFSMYFGEIDFAVIINKISEILSFNPELIESKTDMLINSIKKDLHYELAKISNVESIYCIVRKENNKVNIKCYCILDSDNVISDELENILEVINKIKANFRKKKMNFEVSISTSKYLTDKYEDKYNNEDSLKDSSNIKYVYIRRKK